MLRIIFKKLIPPFFLYLRQALPEYYYDLKLFYKYSAAMGLNSETKLISMIVRDYHVIEKGLTMPESRCGFGQLIILNLMSNCARYISLYGTENEQLKHAIDVVYEYEAFHIKQATSVNERIQEAIDRLKLLKQTNSYCIQKTITKDLYFAKAAESFCSFSWSRASVRNYSEEDLPINLIKQSIDIARNTPSVCNRQTSRVYVFTEKEKIRNILEIQGGNRGFGHLANKLIVVTSELGVFLYLNERTQAFIDGGMFAMNLLYALHYHKIAACILNCSHSADKDRKMRKACPIKESEVFIAMIVCGQASENFKIALSPRNSLDKYLTIV